MDLFGTVPDTQAHPGAGRPRPALAPASSSPSGAEVGRRKDVLICWPRRSALNYPYVKIWVWVGWGRSGSMYLFREMYPEAVGEGFVNSGPDIAVTFCGC